MYSDSVEYFIVSPNSCIKAKVLNSRERQKQSIYTEVHTFCSCAQTVLAVRCKEDESRLPQVMGIQ